MLSALHRDKHVSRKLKFILYTSFLYTNVLCSFHNQLKATYLNGKLNRRVNFLIHHLLQYEKDAYF